MRIAGVGWVGLWMPVLIVMMSWGYFNKTSVL